jgi:urease accessory protein UreF
MSTVQEIESAVQRLPVAQAQELQDWLADYLEDRAELTPEFIASIERGQADLREGRVRRP